MKGQVTLEFTIILTLLLITFLSILTAVRTIQKEMIYEKDLAELRYICNSIADLIVEKEVMGNTVRIFIPKETTFKYSNNFLVCQREKNLIVVSPIPGGFRPGISGEVVGWQEI
ncbi:hypothetical protein KO465_00640 [Candidatus Micrarchaeota archaeon]|nr:hypothetical protein [Candidatus Micrarchaeota archaeon]